MSRYRPPAAPKSPYITRSGFERLKTELDQLWRVRRPEVVRALSAAAAEGDRSENAEYIYRKKELRGIDSRVRYLQKRLDVLKAVDEDQLPDDPNRVFFGAWVTVEDEDGEESTWRIVGPDEFDPERDWISMDAPVAKALRGKAMDDEVTIRLPRGEVTYWITAVHYGPEPPP